MTASPPSTTIEPRRLPAHHRTLRFMIELCRFGGRQLVRHRAPQMAAALAYRTIFSLIPMLVLALVILKAFVGEGGIRYGLTKAMEYSGISELELVAETNGPGSGVLVGADTQVGPPAPEPPARVSEHIEDFVEKTVDRLQSINFGLITVVGVVVLIYAAFSLLLQVEQAFNIVYRAPSGRRIVVRLTNYWVLVTAGSLAVFFGFLISDRSSELLASLPASAWWIVRPLDLLLKVGLTWLILLFAYTRMPNARVAIAPAAVGAAIAAGLWELCKGGLGRFVSAFTGPESAQVAVYGSLALVPLFFLWIYVTWLLVLFGLEVAFALHMVTSGRAAALEKLDQRSIIDPSVAVVLVRAAAERFNEGKSSNVAELAERTGLAEVTVERLLDHMATKGILHRVERSADDDAFALARPPESITAGDVIAAMYDLTGGLSGPDSPAARRDQALLDTVRRAEITALAPLNLHSLKDR